MTRILLTSGGQITVSEYADAITFSGGFAVVTIEVGELTTRVRLYEAHIVWMEDTVTPAP